MPEVPDSMPERLVVGEADVLIDTIMGLINECTMNRTQIMGCLEIAKFNVLNSWSRQAAREAEE